MTDEDLNKIRGIIQEELVPIKETLNEHTGILAEHSSILAEHSDKLDALTADMMEVQTTTKATYELLVHEVDQRQEEVDEIQDYVGMPKLERTNLKQPNL